MIDVLTLSQIIYLVFFILYHISLNQALNPLLYYLPKSLEMEEAALLRSEYNTPMGTLDGHSNFDSSNAQGEKETSVVNGFAVNTIPTPTGPVGIIRKFFRPDIYASYAIMRQLVPRDFADITYTTEVERDAYLHPATTAAVPLLWIPQDIMGVSRQECAHTNRVTPMTDIGAFFDGQGKMVWSEEETGGRPPIWEEPIYY